MDTPLFKAVFTEMGGSLETFQLKKYWQNIPFQRVFGFELGLVGVSFNVERYQDPKQAGAQPKQMVRVAKTQELPLSLTWDGKAVSLPAQLLYEASAPELTLTGEGSGEVRFRAVSPEGLTVTRTYKFNAQNYAFDLEVSVANRTAGSLEGHLDLALAAGEDPDRKGFLGFFGLVNNRLEEVKPGKVKDLMTFSGKVDWAALDKGYFVAAVAPRAGNKTLVTLAEPVANYLTATLRTPQTLQPGQETQAGYTVYFGPKDISELKTLNLGLERLVDFGWFDFMAKPLLYLLKFIDRVFHNYGWSLIILTLLTRLVFWYPNHKSFKSMKDMQRIQPKVQKIREKYKDDREAMNKELMALYRTFKVNPMGSCLPMALQLPVFIALYNILSYAIELRHASFIATLPFTDIVWLADLSAKDPLLITPLVMGASMFIQQKMSPAPGDPAQAKMMMFLPLIFTFLFLNFASGLVIYWLVNNILAIIQQYFTNKYIT